ncbi:hypothetical protein KR059_001980, partial [Drosophila kikkawai]
LNPNMYYLAFTVFVILPLSMNAFNFSPFPSLVLNFPKNSHSDLGQTRSSYFGYTLVIRPSSIIVGAPRSNSTSMSLTGVKEPGAIYRCSLEKDKCSPYMLNSPVKSSSITNNIRDHNDFQWLGGSMDGGTLDTDMLIACAPRFYREIKDEYYMTGACYPLKDTVDKKPKPVTPIFGDRGKPGTYEAVGEMGLSAHVVDDNTNFLIGAPIQKNGTGVIFVYKSGRTDNVDEIGQTTQRNDSYFGYAVSSGHFDSSKMLRLLYVITAPQANEASGEAYIISPELHILHIFQGEQIGEYFGYSVLAEDLNGDKLTDLIVSAPMHARKDSADNGAIYVFINKGSFEFKKKIVRSPLANSARFGTTLSRLGDINHDGFNDVAVGAPFAGNGSVFIYLGSEHGLRDVPSQQLDSPAQHPSKYGAHMFGHGLSRGSDIDGNGFSDLAVGAPNAEAVFLYRTYPVVKLYGTIRSKERQIRPQQKTLNITACYRLSTSAKKWEAQEQDLAIRIVADPHLKRITFVQTQTHELNYIAKVRQKWQCRELELQVSFDQRDVYKPIDVHMHYEIVQDKHVDETSEFCEKCVAVDPTDPNTSTERIVFNAGCSSAICIADLQLNSSDEGSTFTLGSNDILRLTYTITNAGETAYLPQFKVNSTSRLTFAQVPGDCQVSEAVMMCNLNGGQALGTGETDSVTVSFDVSQLSGESLVVTAEVFSTGNEKNITDNKHVNEISLREFTEIDIMGKQTSSQINLGNHGESLEVKNHFEIKSNGPSAVKELTVTLQIPIAYRVNGSTATIPIINRTSVKVLATYESQPLVIELLSNETVEASIEDRNSEIQRIQGRRDLEIPGNTSYDLISGNLRGQLPLNRTIVSACQDSENTICIRASVHGVRLRPGNSVYLNVSYHVNLGEVNAILLNPWQYFVILTDVDLAKKDDPSSSSMAISKRIEPNVITKHLKANISIAALLPSAAVGLIIFLVINYAMYK